MFAETWAFQFSAVSPFDLAKISEVSFRVRLPLPF